MTEKRFTISAESNQNIWDNEEKCYYSSIDAIQLCDLLNELNQEAKDNEHYHTVVLENYKAISKENELLKSNIDIRDKAIIELKEENQQLKNKLSKIEKKIKVLHK